jgi:hypothetical protein
MATRVKPIEAAPLIYEVFKRKYWKVYQALLDNNWVKKIDLEKIISFQQLEQFVELWVLIRNVHLNEATEDDILLRLMANGEYSSKSAYEV